MGLPRTGAEGLGTYVQYSPPLPAPPDDLGTWEWLRRRPEAPSEGRAAAESQRPWQELSLDSITAVAGGRRIPDDVRDYLDEGLHHRFPSATDCYFDLADHAVAVDGGVLVHILSDSQGCMEWMLFLGDDGMSGVVATDGWIGFEESRDEHELSQAGASFLLVSDSFAEFAWRCRMDDEIWTGLTMGRNLLDDEHRSYLAALGRASRPFPMDPGSPPRRATSS